MAVCAAVALFGCNPEMAGLTKEEKRVKRFMKRCPECFKKDSTTVRLDTTLTGFEKSGETKVAGIDTAALESALDEYEKEVAKLTSEKVRDKAYVSKLEALNKKLKGTISTRVLPKFLIAEPVVYDSAGYQLRLWQEGQILRWKLKIPTQKVSFLREVPSYSVENVSKQVTKPLYYYKTFWVMLIIIFLLVGVIYMQYSGKTININVPKNDIS